MRTLVQPATGDSALALALIPGSFSAPEDLVSRGFDAAVRERGIAAEITLGEVRAAWFADGTIVQRIRDTVVEPARERGRTRVWLAGISLGALASLAYAARHEEDLEGIVLLSPYPATREVQREIERAGGPRRWAEAAATAGDVEREAWMWLARAGERLPVHCYYGSGDRFAEGQRAIAGLLPRQHVREMPGGHDWPAWRGLWDAFLAERAPALR